MIVAALDWLAERQDEDGGFVNGNWLEIPLP